MGANILNGDSLFETPGARRRVQGQSPAMLAHIVFRTSSMSAMLPFWEKFLSATIAYANEHIAFLRYDNEHHRVALIATPDTTPRVAGAAGLEHIAFSFNTLEDLAASYTFRKGLGIEPYWCVNHGPTTSIYYRDPDGNKIETQADNFDTIEEADEFMKSTLFAENPVGTDFDPDELVARLKAGVSGQALKKRVEIGMRGLPQLE